MWWSHNRESASHARRQPDGPPRLHEELCLEADASEGDEEKVCDTGRGKDENDLDAAPQETHDDSRVAGTLAHDLRQEGHGQPATTRLASQQSSSRRTHARSAWRVWSERLFDGMLDAREEELQKMDGAFRTLWVQRCAELVQRELPMLTLASEPVAHSLFSCVFRLPDSYLKLIYADPYSETEAADIEAELSISARLGRVGLAPRLLQTGWVPGFLAWTRTAAALCTLDQLIIDQKRPRRGGSRRWCEVGGGGGGRGEVVPRGVCEGPVWSDGQLQDALTDLVCRVANQHVLLYDVKLLNFVVVRRDRRVSLQAIDFGGRWASYRPWLDPLFLSKCMAFLVWAFVAHSVQRELRVAFQRPHRSLWFTNDDVHEALRMLRSDKVNVLIRSYCHVSLLSLLERYVLLCSDHGGTSPSDLSGTLRGDATVRRASKEDN